MSQTAILHLSDIHIRYEDDESFDFSVVFDPLIDRIKEDREKKKIAVELVVLTGDIAFQGKKEEYDIVAKYLTRLMDELDLPTERLFIVPGNHDVNRKLYRPTDRPLYDSMRDLNKELENTTFRSDLFKGQQAYFDFINNYFPHLTALNDNLIPFAQTHETKSGHVLGLLGLNSAWMCRRSPDQGEVAIGEYQLKKAKAHLKTCGNANLNLACFHHPVSWLWKEDQDIAKTYLDRFVLLTGHLHDAGGGFQNDTNGQTFLASAGGAYLGSDSKYPMGYHYLTIDWDKQALRFDFRTFHKRKWILDANRGDDGIFKIPCSFINLKNTDKSKDSSTSSISALSDIKKSGTTIDTVFVTNPHNTSKIAFTKTILLLLVTDTEETGLFNAAKDRGLRPKSVSHGELSYHDFGIWQTCHLFALRTGMGGEGREGSTVMASEAIRTLKPDYILSVGIAFGLRRKKQKIGDVLVSESIISYEPLKFSTNKKTGKPEEISRHKTEPTPTRILNRFKTIRQYWLEENDIAVRFGAILSGSKLVDDPQFKAKLLERFPEAIGGEMEGSGISSAAGFEKKEWIVVKAICDWAENKAENKVENQTIAAKNAADFVFFLFDSGLLGGDQIERNFPEGKPPHSEAIKSSQAAVEKVLNAVCKILQHRHLQYLRQSLAREFNMGEEVGNINLIASRLVSGQDFVNTMSILTKAVKNALETIQDNEADGQDLIKNIWEKSINILGYLVLLSVCSDRLQELKNDISQNIRFEIPVETEAGIEIVYSGIWETPARLDMGPSGIYVTGQDRIDYEIPEGGFSISDKVDEIIHVVTKKVFPEGDVKGKRLQTKSERVHLNTTLAIRKDEGEHFYFCPDELNSQNTMLSEAVYDALKKELPELDIICISTDQGQSFMIKNEAELGAHLTHFFRNKPKD